MRIAIVTPYSWTYPGGVNKHVEALAGELLTRGHELRVLAPWDPPDRLARIFHRGLPERRERPEYLVPLGRTIAIGANGAVSNLCFDPGAVVRMRRELDAFAPDVVHVHEPIAPLLAADAVSWRGAPVVGTFHAYSTKLIPNQLANLGGAWRKLNQLHARIAVSEAAAWTGRRWFGGRYVVIPNGVDIDGPPLHAKPPGEELRLIFVGRPEARKGLPVLLTAFQALVEHVPARLVVVGAEPAEVRRYLTDPAAEPAIEAVGRVGDDELWRRLHEADLLCAPSLSGESFGMVLTEAFAAGTPVIASRIAGYSDVVTDGFDGVLVPPADPQRLAEELQALSADRARLAGMAEAARESARRFAWPRVAERVEGVYAQVVETAAEQTAEPQAVAPVQRLARHAGLVPIDGTPRWPARRLPSLEPVPARSGRAAAARRVALGAAGLLAIALTVIAARRIGVGDVLANIVRSDATWLLVATGLMIASLLLRATSWYAISRAALRTTPPRRRDVTSATMIGVLMSATLPARLGEPARALVLARRTGRMRDTFPVLLGTLVSQSALNVVALLALGVIIVSSTPLFSSSSERLFLYSTVPVMVLIAVVCAPLVVKQAGSGRVARLVAAIRAALLKVRRGLAVFLHPRHGPLAAGAQFAAWGLQLLACFALFTALGLDNNPMIGIGAAAAVLFAVNVTAVVPATPSNIGVFQLATISVLTTGFHVSPENALAYGIILQAIEIATALGLGLPALVREGVTWQDMRLRALAATPVHLHPTEAPESVR